MKSLPGFLQLVIFIFSACVPSSPASAQNDEIVTQFRKITAEEDQRLRAVLRSPIPEDAMQETLRRHFRQKEAAAVRLGDAGLLESVLREAVKRLPDAYLKDNLALELLARGQIEEGNALMQKAIAGANLYESLIIKAHAACALYDQNRDDAARQAISDNMKQLAGLQSQARQTWDQLQVVRSLARNTRCLSSLEERTGKYPQAIAAAEESERHARRALALTPSNFGDTTQRYVRANVAASAGRRLGALIAAGRLGEAEIVLGESVRLSGELELPADYLARLYGVAGNIRFSQREFAQAEALARKSDAVLEKLGYEEWSESRYAQSNGIAAALIGQKNWPAALDVYTRLDAVAGDKAKIKSSTRFSFNRALAYLGNGRHLQAAELLHQHGEETARLHGETHFFTAQARGLEGVALWRMGLPRNKAQALPLLKAAVRDYMAPANAQYLESSGYRKERREEVFAAYLEAIAGTAGENAADALGPADWVRSGSVQDALNDAAVRASASTPALADVVRHDQDAKNEIAGLRRYLSGEAGGAVSPLPEIAAQMRTRIAALEARRKQLQADIKARFPDHERLVRPAMPSAQDIARQLEPTQALLMLLPTADSVYVWAISSDKPAMFARVAMPETEVNRLVAQLRKNLDFASFRGAPTRFDSAAAHALYQRLIEPVSATLQGRTQWIVATGGALSQLPFAVLQTQAGGGSGQDAPWLIKQTAITQVPSLSAWLALKGIAKNRPASQAFMGWGDPAFSAASRTFATSTGDVVHSRKIVLERSNALNDFATDKLVVRSTAPSALRYADIPALPDTREELLAIANTLGADALSDVIVGVQATRASVLTSSKNGTLASRRVVAFATHGLMAGDLPNLTQPALALAIGVADATNPLAPLLTLDDVLTLKLNADWVVLSACNTAAADGRAEEALSGLARGFFYAGARSLLVTHWAVENESAKAITTATFAHYIANPQAPKAESLREAMLKVMAQPQFSHPAFWAPYALVGDGGR